LGGEEIGTGERVLVMAAEPGVGLLDFLVLPLLPLMNLVLEELDESLELK
jgi:hypothetical protein